MRRILLISCFGLASLVASGKGEELTPQEIIQRFASKEAEFKEVWQQYMYRQNILFEVVDRVGRPSEQREVELEVYFTNDKKRQTRIIKDEGELRSIGITKEDLDDAIHHQPFVLTSEELPHYKITYQGKERVDEINTYVFDVKPRRIKRRKRYFKGRIWVDDLDLQIVKTFGKIVPDYRDNKFPEFETIRQQIDGKYWFPVWTKADDHLEFGTFMNKRRFHVREWITYEDFRKFEVGTSIQYESVEEP